MIFLLELCIMFEGDYLIRSNPNEFSWYIHGKTMTESAMHGGAGEIPLSVPVQHNQTISETIKLYKDFYLVQKP